MTRDDLEHIIRASGDVTNQYEFVIVGSQSILGSVPNPPSVFTMSAEADIRADHLSPSELRPELPRLHYQGALQCPVVRLRCSRSKCRSRQ